MVKKTQHSNNIDENLFPNGVRQFEEFYQKHCFSAKIRDK